MESCRQDLVWNGILESSPVIASIAVVITAMSVPSSMIHLSMILKY